MNDKAKKNNLLAKCPEVAAEWHPTKNYPLTPEQVTASSGDKAWWICSYGHEWQAVIRLRVVGSGCPYCYGRYPTPDYNLEVINPQLAAQWHPHKNGDLKPGDVCPASNIAAWWICEKGHDWKAPICHRKKTGCPVCGVLKAKEKRGLVKLNNGRPDLAQEWHPTKNKITPADVSTGSNFKAWWTCTEGHSWQAAVKKRVKGTGCPYCTGARPSKNYNLAAISPNLAKEWHPTNNEKLTPKKVTPYSHKIVWWICKKGHSWKASIQSRNKGTGCPYCSGHKKPG